MASIRSRIKDAWNAFTYNEQSYPQLYESVGPSHSWGNYRPVITGNQERTIMAAIYTRMAIDIMELDFKHVRVDNNERYLEDFPSELNKRLTWSSNLDQSSSDLFLDIATTLFTKGTAVVVPVETSANPDSTGSFDIYQLRVGEVQQWHPEHVKVRVYNQLRGEKKDILLRKESVAIINNPFYSTMNQHNSTLQRLIRKLAMLDKTDEAVSSGKMDLIIQLPYIIKTEARREQAENRKKEIEMQLRGSSYGIAYIDGTEKVTQLNRPAENNLWAQIADLTATVYSELGLTPEIMNGTADQQTMTNYFSRTIKPIANAITNEMTRKFLTNTAYTQNQRIMAFRNPFSIVPVEQIAEIADKFTRNEILSANEIRSIIGIRPSEDPKADELRNSNIRRPDEDPVEQTEESE